MENPEIVEIEMGHLITDLSRLKVDAKTINGHRILDKALMDARHIKGQAENEILRRRSDRENPMRPMTYDPDRRDSENG